MSVMTMKELMTNGCQSSPDGKHWEPSLPIPTYLFRERLSDAWEVFCGRATAIRNTTAADLAPVPPPQREEREPS